MALGGHVGASAQEPEENHVMDPAGLTEDSGQDDCDFFREYYISSIRSGLGADREYAAKPFSELDTVTLGNIAAKYSRCPGEPEFVEITSRIEALRNNIAVYEAAAKLIAVDGPGFTADTPAMIDSVLNNMTAPVSDAQNEEVMALRKVVEIYPSAVDKFKSLVGDLRYQLDREGCAASAEYAKSIQTMTLPAFMKQEENRMANDYKYRISRVPALKVLYDEWLERLRRNILDPRAVAIEEQVLAIATESGEPDQQ